MAWSPLILLNLTRNYITDPSPIRSLRALRELHLSGNEIMDLSDIRHWRSLSHLTTLYLQSHARDVPANPFESQNPFPVAKIPLQYSGAVDSDGHRTACRLFIVFWLAQLTQLDGLSIQVEERKRAALWIQPTETELLLYEYHQVLLQSLSHHIRIHHADLKLSSTYRPVILAGPAGVGKRTLTRRLLTEFPSYFGLGVSHTTRSPRPGEVNGIHYHFVSHEEMQTMLDEGRFVEVVSFFGHWYGNSFDSIYKVALQGKLCLLDLEIEGVTAVKQSSLNPICILILPPTIHALEHRLKYKGQREAELVQRQIDDDSRRQLHSRQQRHRLILKQYAQRHGTPSTAEIPLPLSYGEQMRERDTIPEQSTPPPEYGSEGRTATPTATDLDTSRTGTASTVEPGEDQPTIEMWLNRASRHLNLESVSGDASQLSSGPLAATSLSSYQGVASYFDLVMINDQLETTYTQLKDYLVANLSIRIGSGS